MVNLALSSFSSPRADSSNKSRVPTDDCWRVPGAGVLTMLEKPWIELRACADRLATFHYLSVLRTIKWALHHPLIHSLPAYPRSLLVERLAKKSWLWAAPRSAGKTMGSSCLRWLKSQRTTKLALEEEACLAEAPGAFHHISVATQAAAAATPKTNMSAKWTCHQARWLLACIVLPSWR